VRIAAGILMIIVGLTLPGLTQTVVELIAETVASILEADPVETVFSLGKWTVLPVILLLGLTVGGGICAFLKKHWWWALSGAICSVFIGFAMLIFPVFGLIFPPMGVLAVVFVCRRKREWESRQGDEGG